jgi:hypothetical protein
MSESNGAPQSLKELVQDCLGAVGTDDGTLMRDMLSDYPNLRLAVLGGHRQNHNWPPSTLRISRSGNNICVVLECSSLEVERRTYSQSVFGAFEILEEDLATQPGGWQPNWRGRQRLERQLLS